MGKKRKKRRRRKGSGGGGGGTLMGMRKGFKNVASSVSGQKKPSSRKSSLLSWLLTLAILAAAVGFFLSNR
jgi:hypothetical protein